MKFIRALPLAVLLLVGCDNIPVTDQTSPESIVQTIETVTEVVSTVQQQANDKCKYVPSIGTIISIFSDGNKTVDNAVDIANAICGAITKKKGIGGDVYVNGVKVEGYWTE